MDLEKPYDKSGWRWLRGTAAKVRYCIDIKLLTHEKVSIIRAWLL